METVIVFVDDRGIFMDLQGNLFKANLYRILALPVSASERDVTARYDELRTWARVGKTPLYPRDALWPENIPRTLEDIQECVMIFRSPVRKLEHVMAWFWESELLDYKATSAIMTGDYGAAERIWQPWHDFGRCEINVKKIKNLAVMNTIMLLRHDYYGDELRTQYRKTVDLWNRSDESKLLVPSARGIAGFPEKAEVPDNFISEVRGCLRGRYQFLREVAAMDTAAPESLISPIVDHASIPVRYDTAAAEENDRSSSEESGQWVLCAAGIGFALFMVIMLCTILCQECSNPASLLPIDRGPKAETDTATAPDTQPLEKHRSLQQSKTQPRARAGVPAAAHSEITPIPGPIMEEEKTDEDMEPEVNPDTEEETTEAGEGF